ncbi:MAG TPA: DMT family transporter, partial [Ardenticatenaceae bacterium]|nr:DMT family transporter [Ardenticatenaceae bacterium]
MPRRGLVLILVAAAFWGTTGITSKALYRFSGIEGLQVAFLRLALASPALLVAAQLVTPSNLRRVAFGNWRSIFLFGLGVALSNFCFFAPIPRTSVTAATVLAICTAPLFVAVLARLLLPSRSPRASSWPWRPVSPVRCWWLAARAVTRCSGRAISLAICSRLALV